MNFPSVLRHTRILPAAPKSISGSERNSFSSASAISDSYTKSPEPQPQPQPQPQPNPPKVQQVVPAVTSSKKTIIIVCAVVISLLICAAIVGVTVPLTMQKDTPTTVVATNLHSTQSTTTFK